MDYPGFLAKRQAMFVLSFGGPNWGAPFRFGLFEVPQSDMDLIAGAMTGP